MKPDRITYRCQHCASESIDKQVPYEWNPHDQEWEPNFLKMDFLCRSCGHDQPAAELHRFRGAQVVLAGSAMARLEDAAMFYLEHADLPSQEAETLRAALAVLEDAPIRDLEIDARTGHEWTGPETEDTAGRTRDSGRPNVHPLWAQKNRRTG